MPGREDEARRAIEQAIDYAAATGTLNVHVMAGKASGEEARDTFIANLRHACELAAKAGIIILIEPLNYRDAPGYFLQTSEQALEIIEAVGTTSIRLMFDCYHLQIRQGDLTRRLQTYLNSIGHIQIASVPDRREPDHGEIDYRYILCLLEELGYDRPIGAEYRPATSTEAGLIPDGVTYWARLIESKLASAGGRARVDGPFPSKKDTDATADVRAWVGGGARV